MSIFQTKRSAADYSILKFKNMFYKLHGKHLDIKILDELETQEIIKKNIVNDDDLIELLNKHIPDYIKPITNTILCKYKKRELVELRMIYVKIMREYGYNLDYIRSKLLMSTHSTVIYLYKVCNDTLAQSPLFTELYNLVCNQIKFPEENGGVIKTISRVPVKSKPTVDTIRNTRKSTGSKGNTQYAWRSFSMPKTRPYDY